WCCVSSRRRHTRFKCDWSSDVCSSDLAELAALLEAGELDYIVEYESLARSHHFRFVALPPAVDLGDAREGAAYARARVRVKRGEIGRAAGRGRGERSGAAATPTTSTRT